MSTVMQASAAAVRTHQQTKLDALRNAVLNTALHIAIDDAQQQMFLSFVDQFTEWHLVVLALLSDPEGWAQDRGITYPEWGMGGRSQVVEHAIPSLRGRRDFYDQVVRDLYLRGLLATDSLHVTVSGSGLFQPLSTDTPRLFLSYISAPRATG